MTTQDTEDLRNDYRRIRRTANLYTGDTNEIFDFKVETTLGDMGLAREPQAFVKAANEVLSRILSREEDRLAEREYDGDGYFEDFYDDHMGYDTLEERDMDRDY